MNKSLQHNASFIVNTRTDDANNIHLIRPDTFCFPFITEMKSVTIFFFSNILD